MPLVDQGIQTDPQNIYPVFFPQNVPSFPVLYISIPTPYSPVPHFPPSEWTQNSLHQSYSLPALPHSLHIDHMQRSRWWASMKAVHVQLKSSINATWLHVRLPVVGNLSEFTFDQLSPTPYKRISNRCKAIIPTTEGWRMQNWRHSWQGIRMKGLFLTPPAVHVPSETLSA